MPTTYAHYRFGDHAYKLTDEKTQEIINKYRDLFNIGVHGPDIFFYYNCVKRNKVNDFGYDLHMHSMKEVLERFKPHYLKAENKEATLSYILGFLAHFTFDSYAHSYIEIKEEKDKVSHGRLEAQLDRFYLIKDGFNPNKKKVTDYLNPTAFAASVIANLFDEWDEKTIYKTIRDQVFFLKVLKDDTDLKRDILIKLMKLVKANGFIEMVMGKEDDPRCADSNLRIDKYFERAVVHYPSLARNVIEFLEEDKPLDPYFNYHFSVKDDYRDIPVLPLDEERNYVVEDFQK